MLKKRFHFFHDNLVIVLTKTTNYYMSYQDFFLKKKIEEKAFETAKKTCLCSTKDKKNNRR